MPTPSNEIDISEITRNASSDEALNRLGSILASTSLSNVSLQRAALQAVKITNLQALILLLHKMQSDKVSVPDTVTCFAAKLLVCDNLDEESAELLKEIFETFKR